VAIRAVVFDLFDTLVDLRWEKLPVAEHKGRRIPATAPRLYQRVAGRVSIDFEGFVETLLEGDRAFAESHYRVDREVPTRLRFVDLLGRLGVDDPALADALTAEHMGMLRRGVEVVAHHGAVLDRLRRSVRLGLCSNFSHSETALAVLQDAGLRDRLHPEAVVVSDAFGLRKPRAEIFREVLGRLAVDPAEALHVGDSLRADVGGAAPVGMRTVWITRRVRDPERALEEHEGPAPDFTIADLAELSDLVASLG
jgi:FMN phosphatase YigB (HAD superfamily)